MLLSLSLAARRVPQFLSFEIWDNSWLKTTINADCQPCISNQKSLPLELWKSSSEIYGLSGLWCLKSGRLRWLCKKKLGNLKLFPRRTNRNKFPWYSKKKVNQKINVQKKLPNIRLQNETVKLCSFKLSFNYATRQILIFFSSRAFDSLNTSPPFAAFFVGSFFFGCPTKRKAKRKRKFLFVFRRLIFIAKW